jgi:hypothetical protein
MREVPIRNNEMEMGMRGMKKEGGRRHIVGNTMDQKRGLVSAFSFLLGKG